MNFVKHLENVSRVDISTVGGKGASLSEMMQAGFPVPPGFVVMSEAFNQFLKITGLGIELDAILNNIDYTIMHTIESASARIRSLILSAKIPVAITGEIQQSFEKLGSEYVAVRSSATAEDSMSTSWAGQLESYLNTKEDNVLNNVKKCWVSLFAPRAIFYRFENGLRRQHISVAVIVQKMIESEVSGTAFSVHPVTRDSNHLIIEAGIGLGEAVVSGAITPDNYVVEKGNLNILSLHVCTQGRGLFPHQGGGIEWRNIPAAKGRKQIMGNKEVVKLARLVVAIEQHYGFPVDVEWAKEKDAFYILQSRSITTLKNKGATKMR